MFVFHQIHKKKCSLCANIYWIYLQFMTVWGGRRGRNRNGSWIYNYQCNQCLSALKLWVRIPFRWGVLDTTLCDKVCQWIATGLSPDTLVSCTNKTDRDDIAEILLKVALNTITLTLTVWHYNIWPFHFYDISTII